MEHCITSRIIESMKEVYRTFFLNCLWIASRASLMVTPFRFRAVTSNPNGKCRSIFFTGGSVSIFLSTPGSSSVAGDLLSRLINISALLWDIGNLLQHGADSTVNLPAVDVLLLTSSASVFLVLFAIPCLPSLLLVSLTFTVLRDPRHPSWSELGCLHQLTQVIDVVHSSSARARSPVAFDHALIIRRRGRQAGDGGVDLGEGFNCIGGHDAYD